MIDMPLEPLGMEDPFNPFTNGAENLLHQPGLVVELQEMGRKQLKIFSQVSVLLERKNLFICTSDIYGPNTYPLGFSSFC